MKRGTVRNTECYLRRLPAEARDVRWSDCRRQTRMGGSAANKSLLPLEGGGAEGDGG